MTVVWSAKAIGHLEGIFRYVAESSPLYAVGIIERLHARVTQLEAFPYSGREVPEDHGGGAKELFEFPYRVIYEVRGSQVEVLAVIHMRQEGPGPIRSR